MLVRYVIHRVAEELARDKLLPERFSEGGIADIRAQVYPISYTVYRI